MSYTTIHPVSVKNQQLQTRNYVKIPKLLYSLYVKILDICISVQAAHGKMVTDYAQCSNGNKSPNKSYIVHLQIVNILMVNSWEITCFSMLLMVN